MPTTTSNPAAPRCADTWQAASRNFAAPEKPGSSGTHSDAGRSMPTVASFWRANAGEARVLHAFLFSSAETPVLRFSRQDLGASFCSKNGNFVFREKLAALPELPKRCFTK